MTDEIKERPDRATKKCEVWQRESDGVIMFANVDLAGEVWLRCTDCEGVYQVYRGSKVKPDRYRIRTLEEKPWPPVKTVERCSIRLYRLDDLGEHFLCTEIRDCEIVDGNVVRVIPYEAASNV